MGPTENAAGVVHLTPVLEVRPECVDAFEEGLRGLIGPSRAEEGCLEYNAFRSGLNENMFLLWERWASMEALEAHFRTPHFIAFAAECAPMLTHPAEAGMHFLRPLVPG
jgi:quinol monooxygenase YgiN